MALTVTTVTVSRVDSSLDLYLGDMLPRLLTKRKKKLSQDHRKLPTSSEDIAWGILRDRRLFGLKFRRQHVIRGYILDFYCHELKLAIEIDGDSHIGRKEYDTLRQQRIEENGITFIRINANDLVFSPERIADKIHAAKVIREKAIQTGSWQKPSPPAPLPEGEGRHRRRRRK